MVRTYQLRIAPAQVIHPRKRGAALLRQAQDRSCGNAAAAAKDMAVQTMPTILLAIVSSQNSVETWAEHISNEGWIIASETKIPMATLGLIHTTSIVAPTDLKNASRLTIHSTISKGPL